MQYETSVVYLEQLPKLVVDTGLDIPTLIGFGVTVIIFGLGTWLTVRNSNDNAKQQIVNLEKTLKHQEEALLATITSQEGVANRNSLKASRQAWINDLRDASAQFVASAMNVTRLNLLRGEFIKACAELKEQDPAEYTMAISKFAVDHIEAVKEVRSLSAKIELLLNPEEADSIKLMESVSHIRRLCDQKYIAGAKGSPAVELVPMDLDKPCLALIQRCQVILKTEWEKAKKGQ